MSYTCLHCLRCQPDDNICSDCSALMDTGSLCRCGERIAATGADICHECLADCVRLDPAELDGMRADLAAEVLAHMRKSAEPGYSKPGFLTRKQA